MIWLKLWNTLLIVQAQDIVRNAESIYLLILLLVLVVVKGCGLDPKKGRMTKEGFEAPKEFGLLSENFVS